jgi:hypothetical protein
MLAISASMSMSETPLIVYRERRGHAGPPGPRLDAAASKREPAWRSIPDLAGCALSKLMPDVGGFGRRAG